MDPHASIAWLMAQDETAAVRARRLLDLHADGDEQHVRDLVQQLVRSQQSNGGFDSSPMKTAGVVALLADLRPANAEPLVDRAVSFLLSVLKSQPGYERATRVEPGSLQIPCDLCGFFGPYGDRGEPGVVADGAREMNAYREYEPLLGPKSPVRATPRSSRDRVGPGSCYSWGLIPLCAIVEAICRAGSGADPALAPTLAALLGAQRQSGGWCRNLGGHPKCTLHALRAIGAHPRVGSSHEADSALAFMARTWRRVNVFTALHAVIPFGTPMAHALIRDMLREAEVRQQPNGTFGKPCQTERVAAVLLARQKLHASATRP